MGTTVQMLSAGSLSILGCILSRPTVLLDIEHAQVIPNCVFLYCGYCFTPLGPAKRVRGLRGDFPVKTETEISVDSSKSFSEVTSPLPCRKVKQGMRSARDSLKFHVKRGSSADNCEASNTSVKDLWRSVCSGMLWSVSYTSFSEQRFRLGIHPLPMLLNESELFTVAGLA
ncbi:uncharacterized protein LJ206_001166 isoform 1-T1 [Theristicus caerulescens]